MQSHIWHALDTICSVDANGWRQQTGLPHHPDPAKALRLVWVFFIGLKAQHQAGALLFAGGRALVQGLWLRSHPGLIGSAWIGTEQVSNQLQAIVDSNRLDERDRTAADILGLSEVGFFSITSPG